MRTARLTRLAFLLLAILAAACGAPPTPLPTRAPPPPPLYSSGAPVNIVGDNRTAVSVWSMNEGCQLGNVIQSFETGTPVEVVGDPCFHGNHWAYYYQVFADGVQGWVREEFLTTQQVARNTPLPTATRDTRSDFDRCVQDGQGIRYAISEDGVTQVSLTWENDMGGTEQGDYFVPFCKSFRGFNSGEFLYISAQIVRPTEGAGSITCRIYDGPRLISQASAHGFANIATCSGRAP